MLSNIVIDFCKPAIGLLLLNDGTVYLFDESILNPLVAKLNDKKI